MLNFLFHKRQTEPEQKEVDVLPPCDFCRQDPNMIYKAARYHCKTDFGWADICEEHFRKYGQGIGNGKGYRLIVRRTGTF